ncbi:MAG: ferric reductase-like transmembrane domain-containing protein [Spirochaetales bacterium]|uniref:Ferric reductase-like transmembrane domain-containing protein n=1 Tax=Candidatus Thalassospirochaeta sargassi TaxID=3119039 RepID=A0AAJ1MND5_9SPIO|nr:ferric reductase-like transmembrane domain-containing protein [Spirochaetales bacterium]
MTEKSRLRYIIPGVILYLAVPLLYMIFGNFPDRTILKEAVSLLTVGAFFLMLGQFYLTRINKITLKGQKFSRVVILHKVIGYVFIPVLFLHPFLVVFPRYYEGGVDPVNAFKTILTTFGSKGIIMGFAAMALMILIGITSMFRKKMKMKYTTWRYSHGFLSIAFVVLATWHAVDLGRHTDAFLSTYMIGMAAIGIFFLAKLYFVEAGKIPQEAVNE